MGVRYIDTKDVSGISVVLDQLGNVDKGLGIEAAGYSSTGDQYHLRLSGNRRNTVIRLDQSLLNDIRDNPSVPGSEYTEELHSKLLHKIRTELTRS